MSSLTNLIAQSKAKDAQLGSELEREFKVLSSRLPFGLNFERHRPEAVELPLRPIRKGDKVRVLPERGSTKKGESHLWQVKAIQKTTKMADLVIVRPELLGTDEAKTQSVRLENLVVVAEFRDTIYPGLVSTGKVQRGSQKAFHSVINGENYHVLKLLTYTHRSRIDAIYIDPPFNTGAKDWKYNNDYVEADDLYRHSKWLAFMERRLQIAKELLNPNNSILVVAIDEKEYLRLGLLLEQIFPESSIQMVSSVINPAGAGRNSEFSRTDEYLYFVRFGDSSVLPEQRIEESRPVTWDTLRRSDLSSVRPTRPGQFYPIYVNKDTSRIDEIGAPIPHTLPREQAPQRENCVAVFPVRPDGTEMNWGITSEAARKRLTKGYIRVGRHRPSDPQPYVISYLTEGIISDIELGNVNVTEVAADGSVIAEYVTGRLVMPTTQWVRPSHDAQRYGTETLKALIPDRRFPFPKSLYAVEDALRFFIKNNPDAVVLDFFSGSGTTAHAVMRLNRQDGGHRQCISVTNNEVAATEQSDLRIQGLRPGDPEWEQWGICDYITKPRVHAAITGIASNGEQINGDYKFTDEFPMAEGFEENAEFFTLTYEAKDAVNHNLAYSRIAPLLWLRAGACGERIEKLPVIGWAVADTYGLLIEVDQATPFIKSVCKAKSMRIAYIVTDDDRRFQAIAKRLPDGVEPVRLYESYLTNFSFANGE